MYKRCTGAKHHYISLNSIASHKYEMSLFELHEETRRRDYNTTSLQLLFDASVALMA